LPLTATLHVASATPIRTRCGRLCNLSLGENKRILILPALLAALAVAYQGSVAHSDPRTPALAASQSTPQAQGTFKFAAAGDHSSGSRTAASLGLLDQAGVAFYLALGDLDYDSTPTDEAWCDYVKQRLPTLGPTFPFELVSGNHEEQGGRTGTS
jgi:hypothetical protein